MFKPLSLIGALLFGGLALAPEPKQLSEPSVPISISAPIVQSPIPPSVPISSPVQVVKPRDRPLRLSITVNDTSYLRVGVGDPIKEGDVLVDNTEERSRLNVQKQTISLEIKRLKDKQVLAPLPPRKLLPIKPLPAPNYSQEFAAISQAKLHLQQAKSILASRSPWLNKSDDSAYKQAESKMNEQFQMLKSMKDLQMQPEVIQHEEALIKELQRETNKAKLELNQAKGKQLQELQQLQINVQLAESELQQKQAALAASRSQRQLQEFQASIDANKQVQQEEQIALEHSRQVSLYYQQQRDKDYQLAELNIRQHQVEDKLADLPIVRSPRDGYIKRIKPWVGKDGKYSTTLTISSFSPSHSTTSSRSNSSSNSQGKVQTGTKNTSNPSTPEPD
jgi:hypothetical protein